MGNIIHGCVVDVIKETDMQLALISCMIRDNLIPRDAFHRVSASDIVYVAFHTHDVCMKYHSD